MRAVEDSSLTGKSRQVTAPPPAVRFASIGPIARATFTVTLGALFAVLGPADLARAGQVPASDAARPVSKANQVIGLVVDSSGAAVAGAVVRIELSGTGMRATETGADGHFLLTDVNGGDATVRVTAPGFAEASVPVIVGPDMPEVHVVLQPAPLEVTVTVTASRGAAQLETPASTTVITSAGLLASGGGMVDDVLRNTPGFSLNRRSSSRASPPPSQGVALRGIPGIGASRTLVLADGLPLNDPFGGWVYWNRIPMAAIDRVEVLRGGAGDLYGADAMGGAIQLLTFTPGTPRFRGFVEGGTQDTFRGSFFGGKQSGAWGATMAGEWANTGGIMRVPPGDRGSVDRPMTSNYRTGFATVGYTRGGWLAQARVAAHRDNRQRGTPILVDNTTWRQVSGDVAGTIAGGALQSKVAVGSEDYFNNFSSIGSGRNTERLTTEQTIPSRSQFFGSQWSRGYGGHVILIGAEGKHTTATVRETQYSVQGVPTGPILTGGTEGSGAVFARTSLAASERVTIVLGARGDVWKSNPLEAGAPKSALNFFSPSAAVSFRVSQEFTLRTGVTRAYRTPTLDELHRGSRQGNVLTNPNPLLKPERLTGFEGSVLWTRSRASARATGFFNLLDGMVANVTVSSTPSLITRKKENVDTSHATGLELEADIRPARTVTLNAQASLTSSHFVEAPLSVLAGKRVPQMPRYQVGAGLTWAAPLSAMLSVQWRATGAQFDDDLNTLNLGAFTVTDLNLSRQINRRLHLYLAVENLFDVEYDVGRTPNRTIGLPRTVRAGLRTFLP